MLLGGHIQQKLKQEIQHSDKFIHHQQSIWGISCLFLPYTSIAKLRYLISCSKQCPDFLSKSFLIHSHHLVTVNDIFYKTFLQLPAV